MDCRQREKRSHMSMDDALEDSPANRLLLVFFGFFCLVAIVLSVIGWGVSNSPPYSKQELSHLEPCVCLSATLSPENTCVLYMEFHGHKAYLSNVYIHQLDVCLNQPGSTTLQCFNKTTTTEFGLFIQHKMDSYHNTESELIPTRLAALVFFGLSGLFFFCLVLRIFLFFYACCWCPCHNDPPMIMVVEDDNDDDGILTAAG